METSSSGLNARETQAQATLAIKTPCQGCVFSRRFLHMKDACTLGRLETFFKEGTTLMETDGHWTVGNRFCSAYRPDEWRLTSDIKQEEGRVMEELRLRHLILMIIDKSTVSDFSIEKLNQTLASVPEDIKVAIILHDNNILPSTLLVELMKYPIVYSIKEIKDEYYNRQLAVNKVLIENPDRNYITHINFGNIFDKDYFNNINVAINTKLKKFLIIHNDSMQTIHRNISSYSHEQIMEYLKNPVFSCKVEDLCNQ